MRKRRQVLQVSTFPFLAVLLCAMGSLILLLLVIDRQAKVVARNKGRLAEAEAAAKRKQRAGDRQADWERRRAELHARLARQQEELQGGVKDARGKVDAAARDVQAEEARSRELRQRLEAELARLLRAQGELTAQRAAVSRVGDKVEASKSQKTRLAEELAQMERAVKALKELRERDKQTYSLVPYKGRRGDGRRPLYLECSPVGVIFHPDRLTLFGAAEVRAEVERRVAWRRQQDTSKTPADPYLLMLVRPDGIVNYYRAMGALGGLKVGFGYEFIDADWVLDFSADEDATRAQPWMVAKQTATPPVLPRPPGAAPRGAAPRGSPPTGGPELSGGFDAGPSVGVLPRPGTAGEPYPAAASDRGPRAGGATGGSGTGQGSGTEPENLASLGLPTYGPSGAWRTGGKPGGPFGAGRGRQSLGPAGTPGTGPAALEFGGPSGSGTLGFPGWPKQGGNGSGALAPFGPPGMAAGVGTPGLPRWPGQGANASGALAQLGPPGVPTRAGIPAPTGWPRQGEGTPGTPGQPGSAGGTPGGGAPGLPGALREGGNVGGSPTQPDAPGLQGADSGGSGGAWRPGGNQASGGPNGAGTGSPTGTAPAGDTGSPGAPAGAQTGQGVAQGAASGSAQASGGAAGGGPSSEGAGATGDGKPGQRGGQAGSGERGDGTAGQPADGFAGPPGPRLLQSQGSGRRIPSRPPPSPLSRLTGNRDWVIAIECKADAVVVQPWRLRFPIAPAPNGKEHPLVQAVRQLIARRQATVREGEPPYRPLVRFQVHPDGLRSYYFAYPLLEPLRVPMSRENLEPPNPLGLR